VTATVHNTVMIGRVMGRWQPGPDHAVARTVIATDTTDRMGLPLPTAAVQQMIANATKPTYVCASAHGSARGDGDLTRRPQMTCQGFRRGTIEVRAA
jgi:hypothetical protein